MPRPFSLPLALLALAAGCASNGDGGNSTGDAAPEVRMWSGITAAVAVIHPTQGNDARGTVTFTKVADGVRVVADLEGLTPGEHGFHIHEFGDCTAPDASSAGGHYDPDGHRHGGPGEQPRHAGDMGNITAGEDGRAHMEATFDNFSIAGLTNPVLGRAVIVHEGADDLQSQPSGAAGPRVGCGVIGIAQQP